MVLALPDDQGDRRPGCRRRKKAGDGPLLLGEERGGPRGSGGPGERPPVLENEGAAAPGCGAAARDGDGAGPAAVTRVAKGDPRGCSMVLESHVFEDQEGGWGSRCTGLPSQGEKSAPVAGGAARVHRLGPTKLKVTLGGRDAEVAAQEGIQRQEALDQEGAVEDQQDAKDGGMRAVTGGETEAEGQEEDEHEAATAEGKEEDEEDEKEGKKAEGSTIAGDGTWCFLCSKSFRSRKSLYGHMRKHPDRYWRGITPPPGARLKAPPSSRPPKNPDNRDAPPLAAPASPLRNWGTTQKRGRKGTKSHSPFRSSYFWDGDAIIAAVCNLLRIANGYYNADPVEPQMKTDTRLEGETVSFDGLSSNPTDVELESENMETYEDLEQQETANGDVDGGSEEHDHDVPDNKKKRKIKELGALHEPRPPGRNRRYKCNTCNKCFPTHQALGGHRASHKKEKSTLEEEIVGDVAEAAAHPPSVEQPSVPPVVLVPKLQAVAEHRCDRCSMVFPTGQSLGGHKRKHWNGHDASAATSTVLLPKKSSQRLLLNPSSEPPEEIVQRSAPGHGNPAVGPSQVNVQQRTLEFGASPTPLLGEIALRQRGSDREKASDASSSKGNVQQHGCGANEEAAASPTKENSQTALDTLHDFDLNEKPKDGQGEEDL